MKSCYPSIALFFLCSQILLSQAAFAVGDAQAVKFYPLNKVQRLHVSPKPVPIAKQSGVLALPPKLREQPVPFHHASAQPPAPKSALPPQPLPEEAARHILELFPAP